MSRDAATVCASRVTGQSWGITIVPHKGWLRVAAVSEDGPMRGVLAPGDEIVLVNGFRVDTIVEIKSLFAAATKLQLTIVRGVTKSATTSAYAAASIQAIQKVLGEPRRVVTWDRDAMMADGLFSEAGDGFNAEFHDALDRFVQRQERLAIDQHPYLRAEGAAVEAAAAADKVIAEPTGFRGDESDKVIPAAMPPGIHLKLWKGGIKRHREIPQPPAAEKEAIAGSGAGILKTPTEHVAEAIPRATGTVHNSDFSTGGGGGNHRPMVEGYQHGYTNAHSQPFPGASAGGVPPGQLAIGGIVLPPPPQQWPPVAPHHHPHHHWHMATGGHLPYTQHYGALPKKKKKKKK